MRALQVAFQALRAQHAAVERKILQRLEADDLVVFHLELNAALLPAEATVRLDDLLGPGFFLPASRRYVVQVRTVEAGQFVERKRGLPRLRRMLLLQLLLKLLLRLPALTRNSLESRRLGTYAYERSAPFLRSPLR